MDTPTLCEHLRRAYGLSREKLARRADISTRTVYNVEVRRLRPTPRVAAAMGRVLGVDPALLRDNAGLGEPAKSGDRAHDRRDLS